MSETNEKGLNLLAIDGGGARGLSALITLSAIMDQLQKTSNLPTSPRPYDYFDLMAGTGTGGIQVILLGRLGMSVEDAKSCYSQLASKVFAERRLLSQGGPAFKASKLEQTLHTIIEKVTGDPHTPMIHSLDGSNQCKVMVCAMSMHNMTAGIPCLMRTYIAPENQMPNYTICEVLRATTAHPELLKPVELGESCIKESFVDGGLGCNNPIEQLIAEAKLVFPGRHISSIISIGAGHTRTIQIPKPGLFRQILPINALIAAKHIATDCEQAAQEIARRFVEVPNVYFRFNVDQGLQAVGQSEWERLGEVTAHTRAYLQLVETIKALEAAGEAIKTRKCVVETKDLDGRIKAPATSIAPVKACPPPSPVFTGRDKEIQKIASSFFNSPSGRPVFVLHGLGGTGKTQIALRFIELTQDRFTDIIYADATSHETIVASLNIFATAKKLGDQTYKHSLEYLSKNQQAWLLVFNNADSPDLDLRAFFPTGSHGHILVTTRNRDLALLAQGDHSSCQVSGHPPNEALQLLLKTSKLLDADIADDEEQAGLMLVESFGYLPLAIVQAGAYIWRTNCSIVDYQRIYEQKRRVLLEEYAKMPVKVDDYQNTVYTTWAMSYERLGPGASQLLHLISFTHHEFLKLEDMFQRARENLVDYVTVLPFSEHETEIETWVKEYLGSFIDAGGAWDSQIFLSIIAEITSYSLIDYDRLNRAYSLHPLVHDWARTVTREPLLTLERTARIVALSVGLGRSSSDMVFRQSLAAHIDEILRQTPDINVNNCARYVIVYQEGSRPEVTEKLQLLMLDAVRPKLGENNISTLGLLTNLAGTYKDLGGWNEAEALFENTLKSMKQLLGEEDMGVLVTMNSLASIYLLQGRLEDAEKLEARVLDLFQKNTTSDGVGNVGLGCLQNLATIYHAQGRWREAQGVQLELLEICKAGLGEDHPGTLKCMASLAETYVLQYRWDEAEALQERVLEALMQSLGPRNPATTAAMHSLAITYSGQRRVEEAEHLQDSLVILSQEVLGMAHADTLTTLDTLASTYGAQGRWDDAERLFSLGLVGRKALHGDEHPHTLSNMNNLAATYVHLGRWNEAKELLEHVVLHRKRIYGEGHPNVLTSINGLSAVYLELDELENAEELQVQAVEGRIKALGEDHPRTLTCIHNLGQIYLKQGRFLEAAERELRVSNAMKRIYGFCSADTISSMMAVVGIYIGHGLVEEAELVRRELIEGVCDEHREPHQAVPVVMELLAEVYKKHGRQQEFEVLEVWVSQFVSDIKKKEESGEQIVEQS